MPPLLVHDGFGGRRYQCGSQGKEFNVLLVSRRLGTPLPIPKHCVSMPLSLVFTVLLFCTLSWPNSR